MNAKTTFENIASPSKDKFPLRAGDQVRVYSKIKEGERGRVQAFEGIVLASRGRGLNRTFTVRRIGVGGIGVERIFPVNSPYLEKVEVVNHMDVRRAKLYYLRKRMHKTPRIR